MEKMNLSLEPERGNAPAPPSSPVAGYLATAFGLLGIFSVGYVFVPLALLCTIVAFFKGQVFWGTVGLLLSVIGVFTSPVLLVALGLSALAAFFGLPPA